MRYCFKRSRYVCSVDERNGEPVFSVTVIEWNESDESSSLTYTESSPSVIWRKILESLELVRKANNVVKIHPEYLSGEYMFGLNEPHIIRLIESLPGVETLTNYAFKFGRLQLLDMPLTINPTGCARSEPKLRTHFRKSHTLTCNTGGGGVATQTARGSSSSTNVGAAAAAAASDAVAFYESDSDSISNQDDDYYAAAANVEQSAASSSATVSYIKQFSFSKSTQIKKLKAEWRTNVYLAKSQIQVKRIVRVRIRFKFHFETKSMLI